MADFPFQLSIKVCGGGTESIICNGLLRSIPGVREVLDGRWKEREVILKVFFNRFSAKRHLKREWKGLKRLQERRLNAPAPLAYGQTADGQWVVVIEKITNASIASEIFKQLPNTTDRLNLLAPICRELARQHEKAVIQKDLHLGNFMLKGERVFILDPAQMRFLSRPLSRKKGLSQLALLGGCLSDNSVSVVREIYRNYASQRGWDHKKSDEDFLQKQLIIQKQKQIRRGLLKSLRTGKSYFRIKDDRYHAMFDREFCRNAEPVDFINRLDDLMEGGEIIKRGNTCFVSRTRWNNKDVVIKRYNHRGVFHSLRHTIKKCRARRAWLHGHRLGMLEVPTPRPVGFIEQYKNGLIWRSYLVTEHIKGQRLCDFMKNGDVSAERRTETTVRIRHLIDKLGRYFISHGDLKHSNILVTDQGPVITDLDALIVYRRRWFFEIRRQKDIARFEQYGMNHSGG